MNINQESHDDGMTKQCPKCRKHIGDRNEFCSRACFNEYHCAYHDGSVSCTITI